jgi:putative ABC transport system ATP-binding protein
MSAVVRISGITKRYPSGEGPVLSEVALEVERGAIHAIVGPSGSGKSTLLNILGLLDQPSAGRYLLDGVDVSLLSDKERTAVRAHKLGFVFQAHHLLPQLSVAENVALPLVHLRVRGRQRLHRVKDALESVGLSEFMHALPPTLSGGERQRVAIARALVHDPPLILCDEPTGNLDTANSTRVMEILQRLVTQAGRTVVVVTHDDTVAGAATSTTTIRDGRTVARR